MILSPAILSCRWNLCRTHTLAGQKSNSSNLVFELPEHLTFALEGSEYGVDEVSFLLDKVWESLEREGIAILQTPWADATSPHLVPTKDLNSKLIQLVQNLHCTPHMHSDVTGSVWDVRPEHDKVVPTSIDIHHTHHFHKQNPRSKTAEAFGMHTDCSFESPPPR